MSKSAHFLWVLFLFAPMWFWHGFLGAIVWRWFAVETFGVAPLSAWQAAGVIALIRFFWPTRRPEDIDDTDEARLRSFGQFVAYGFFGPVVQFGIAAFIHWMVQP